jgi:hypothetical protein
VAGEKKESEYEKQARLRAERRSHKKRGGKASTHTPQPKDLSITKLVLEVKGFDKDIREVAYDDLVKATTLRTYFGKLCNTPKDRKHTVSLGRIELKGPKAILQQIEHELRAGWQRGKLVPSWAQEQAEASV